MQIEHIKLWLEETAEYFGAQRAIFGPQVFDDMTGYKVEMSIDRIRWDGFGWSVDDAAWDLVQQLFRKTT